MKLVLSTVDSSKGVIHFLVNLFNLDFPLHVLKVTVKRKQKGDDLQTPVNLPRHGPARLTP